MDWMDAGGSLRKEIPDATGAGATRADTGGGWYLEEDSGIDLEI
jgi:hypothetical protein